MNFYCLIPDHSYTTDHYVIDDPRKPAHNEVLGSTRILILEKRENSDNYTLWRYDLKGAFTGDTWHPSLEEAKHQAVFEYGDAALKWVEIPNDVQNALIYIFKIISANKKLLEDFYEYAILPEFGIERTEDIIWSKHERIGPDDYAHYFSIDSEHYVLVFRDYDVFLDEELKKLIKTRNGKFHYIETFSGEKKFHFKSIPPKENKYIENITGTFVLLKI
jgi:hypothetical protein